MKEDVFESRELLESHFRRRKRRKRVFALIMAIAILLTFAIPVSMMFPVEKPPAPEPESHVPVYSAELAGIQMFQIKNLYEVTKN